MAASASRQSHHEAAWKQTDGAEVWEESGRKRVRGDRPVPAPTTLPTLRGRGPYASLATAPRWSNNRGVVGKPRDTHGPWRGPPTQAPLRLPAAPGATAALAGPAASSTSSPSHPILPPISNLDHPHRPSLPPPLPLPGAPPQQHHPPPPSQPPQSLPPPPGHLARPHPPPYDAHVYPRAHSSSPSAHISNHPMASHAPPPPQHPHPQGPSPPGPPPPGMMAQHPPYHYGPPGPPLHGHPPPPHMDPNPYHRMALPASVGMPPGHRPNKKEIKRRTKTGCLTCRKRRIKCDEGHPTCRNCEKSKRHCQGYDPIFKSQAQPSSIQAAPNATATSRPQPASPATYAPATTQPYMAGPPNPAYPPSTAATSSGSQTAPQHYSIDPSLEPTTLAMTAPTTIDQLLDIGERAPPPLPESAEPPSTDSLAKAKEIYNMVYGAGLDKFFDTTWFGTRSWQHIAADATLVAKVTLLESRLYVTAERDAEANKANQSLEGHLLWEVMQLCQSVARNISHQQPASEEGAADLRAGVQDAARRIQAFEVLITNQHTDVSAMIPQPEHTPKVPGNPQLPAQIEDRRASFWHALSKFTTLRIPDASPSSSSEGSPDNIALLNALNDVENCLSEIRHVLDAFENRDILYSVAIVRHYLRPGADRVPPPSSNDEADRSAKLTIARNFLAHEKHSGTFQVAKVVAGMVVRSWRPEQDGS